MRERQSVQFIARALIGFSDNMKRRLVYGANHYYVVT